MNILSALCYKPEVFKEHIAAITDNDFDELQRKALDVLSEQALRTSFLPVQASV